MAIDALLKISGVEGESKIADHENEIDVLSWGWGMDQSGTMHVGGGGGAGKVDVHDISLTKNVDKATPALIRSCCNGEHFDEAVLVVRKAGKDALDYLKITMTSVLVTSYQTGGSDGDPTLTENINLCFAKFKCSYTPQKEDGTGDADIDIVWNIEKNVEE
jgi:type VI secretion system secreted protein Hcp